MATTPTPCSGCEPAGCLSRDPGVVGGWLAPLMVVDCKTILPMSALSDFIIWSGEGLPDYDGIRKFPDADRFQLKNITPLEAAGLLEALRGTGDRLSMISEFPCLTPEQAET